MQDDINKNTKTKNMKMLFSIVCSLIFSTTFAQLRSTDTLERAYVKDWGRTTYQFNDQFWDSARIELLPMIGERNIERVRSNSAQFTPNAFKMWDFNRNHKRIRMEEWQKRMNSLKIYRYACFSRRNPKGETRNHCILAIPYQPLYWDSTTKWDTIYVIAKADAVSALP
jgi:hypothetical protein